MLSDKQKQSKDHYRQNKYLVILALLTFLIIIAVNYYPALPSWLAIGQFLVDPKYENLVFSYESEKEIKRAIQKHFLSHNIYIPTEDIVIRDTDSNDLEILKLIAETCGKADAYIWVPIKYRLPLIGEQTLEWCLAKTWKNHLKFP